MLQRMLRKLYFICEVRGLAGRRAGRPAGERASRSADAQPGGRMTGGRVPRHNRANNHEECIPSAGSARLLRGAGSNELAAAVAEQVPVGRIFKAEVAAGSAKIQSIQARV